MAGSMIAANLIRRANFGTAAVNANVDRVVKALPSRGVGFVDGRSLTSVPRYAAVGEAN